MIRYLMLFLVFLTAGCALTVSECEDEVGIYRNSCILRTAIDQNNPQLCDGVETASGTEEVKRPRSNLECYIDFGKETKRSEVCEYLRGQSSQVEPNLNEPCYQRLAEAFLDTSLCQKITENEYRRERCISDVTRWKNEAES